MLSTNNDNYKEVTEEANEEIVEEFTSPASHTTLTISNYTAKKKLELYYNDILNEEITCILCFEKSNFKGDGVPSTHFE